ITAGPDVTGKMGAPLEWAEPAGDEDTLVRAAAGQTDPYAPPLPAGRGDPRPPARTGTDPFSGGEATPTHPHAQALSPPPARPAGPGEIPRPRGGLLIEERRVLEAEALLIPEAPPPQANLAEEMNEALRRAGAGAPPRANPVEEMSEARRAGTGAPPPAN